MLPSKDHRPNLPALSDLSTFKPNLDPRELIAPLKSTVLSPTVCWKALKNDGSSFADVYLKYVFILAAIAPISGFIGSVIFGRAPFLAAVLFAILAYLATLVLVYLAAVLACYSTHIVKSKTDLNSAGKLVIYSLMPYFVCGIFLIHPKFVPFVLAGSYSFFLFFRGIEVMSNVHGEGRVLYWMINVVPWIFLADYIVHNLIKSS